MQQRKSALSWGLSLPTPNNHATSRKFCTLCVCLYCHVYTLTSNRNGTTNDGIPVIGELPGVKGAFIASGHGCWGILNGPATGEALAELLVDGKTKHLDISLLGVDSPCRR